MSKVEEKIDKIQEDVTDIKVVLTRNTSSLEEHMRRTAAAEMRLELLEDTLEVQLKPIKEHVTLIQTVVKVVVAVAAIAVFLKQIGLLNIVL